MLYIITDGKQYISSTGGIKTVASIKKAGEWELDKANNIMRSIPIKLKMFDWKCVPSVETQENKVEEIKHPIKSLDDYKGLTDNILERMIDWEIYIKSLQEYMTTIDDQLSLVDMEICDIRHYAENFDLNMYQGWKLYKMLQDACKRRRKIKDERIKVDYILARNFVDCTNNAISTYIKKLDNRKYTPRVLKELFNV
jgi:hypothetical protein